MVKSIVVGLVCLQSTAAGASAIPIYPRAVAGARPAGVGLKKPPPKTRAYVTSDDFAKVRAWYRQHLKGANEVAQLGMADREDAFLVANGASARVVMVQRYKGKTWILIGPPA